MDSVKLTMSRQDAELALQALDVYATTLMCAPLGLGLELLVSVRELRGRLEQATEHEEAVSDAAAEGNVLRFARA